MSAEANKVDKIYTNRQFLNKLQKWSEAVAAVKEVCPPLLEAEMALRKEVFSHAFPVPKEGTNQVELPHGWVLKGQHKLSYKVDADALVAVFTEIRKMGFNPDPLVVPEPKLVLANYRLLPENIAHIFNQALEVKPQSPILELIAPPPVEGDAVAPKKAAPKKRGKK